QGGLHRFPEHCSRMADECLKDLVVLMDMPKQLQTWDDPLRPWLAAEVVTERLCRLLHHLLQGICFIEEMRIERGTSGPFTVKDILQRDRGVVFFLQKFDESGTDQVIRALGTTILFLLLHDWPPFLVNNSDPDIR